jgi:hypothetical protein
MAQSRAILRRTLHRNVRLVTQPLERFGLAAWEAGRFHAKARNGEMREDNFCFQRDPARHRGGEQGLAGLACQDRQGARAKILRKWFDLMMANQDDLAC